MTMQVASLQAGERGGGKGGGVESGMMETAYPL